MDVIFIPAFFSDFENIRMPPVGLEILNGIVNDQSRFSAMVLDFNLLSIGKDMTSPANYAAEILTRNPKIVSFYSLAFSFHISLETAKLLKEYNPDITVIFAGPHASLTAEHTLNYFKFIDLVGIGEGERAIVQIIEGIIEKMPFHRLPNIAFRNGNDIVRTDEMDLVDNLDESPIIEYDEHYFDKWSYFPIEVGRGCPFNCTFCSTKTFWRRKFRMKSIERLIREIVFYRERYAATRFNFIHDLFTVNKQYIMGFCDRIRNESLNIKWRCSARIDTLDEEMISHMSEVGCDGIFLGIETYSAKMQRIINKNLDFEKCERNIALLAKHNIPMKLSFIYGIPGETEKDINDTLDFIKWCRDTFNIFQIRIGKCRAFPGSDLYDQNKETLISSGKIEEYLLWGKLNNETVHYCKKYPDVFAQFYNDLDNDALKSYYFLDLFIFFPYMIIFRRCPITFRRLSAHYANLSDWYHDYLPSLHFIRDNLEKANHGDFEFLVLNKFRECTGDLLIKDLFCLEIALFDFKMNQGEKTIPFETSHDLIRYFRERQAVKSKKKYLLSEKDGRFNIREVHSLS